MTSSNKKKILQNENLTELEKVLLNSYKVEMVAFVNSSPKEFDELIELSLSDKQPFAWRAAFILSTVMKKNDKRISSVIDEVINAIDGKPDGHKRELLKILLKLELSEEQESQLIDICINLWKELDSKPTVRFYALRMLMNIAKKYPDLESEIRLLTNDLYMDSLTQGIRRVIEKRLGFDSSH
ncbi:MAG: hypothetical protein CVV25_03865 [Ignavibacteriae bacterium HGW-Ignavibacteriae-4]|jgi:hypothetical protein|nr:MAG: hypothetical protein CVV25_03865 [Ignavibacteriae bacterium HGW-Ignavibacteriae-4]